MSTITVHPPTGVAAGQRPAATWIGNLVTALGGLWMVGGLFYDGHTHVFTPELESFFTPAHGVLYSGFLATAGWVLAQVLRAWRAGHKAPAGYGLGLLGAGVFAAGGPADLGWHTLFGIEADLEALLSPTHLILFIGAGLLLTTPWRAAWSTPGAAAPGVGEFLPVLLSAAATLAYVGFFVSYLSPFIGHIAPTTAAMAQLGGPPHSEQLEQFQARGIANLLVTTVLLVGALMLVLRRWRPPAGTATVLFAVTAVALDAVFEFQAGWVLLASLVGGLAGDALIAWLRPAPDRPWALRAVGGLVPLALWLPYMGLLASRYGLAWSAPVWSGAVVLSVLTGFALALLAAPPPVPTTGPPRRST
jgi:hypothetical protein